MLKGMPKGMKGLHQNMKRGSNLGEEAALAGNAGNITGAATGAGPQFKKGGKAKRRLSPYWTKWISATPLSGPQCSNSPSSTQSTAIDFLTSKP